MVALHWAVVLAWFGAAGEAEGLPASLRGVVVDFRGPPERANFKLDYTVVFEGKHEPHRRTVSHGGYSSTVHRGDIISWELQGYVVEKVGQTQMRIIGRKGPDGRVIPARDVKFESKDLRPDQLPTVVRAKG
jgi:hypothetical protein